MKNNRFLLVALVLSFFLAACGGGGKSSSGGGETVTRTEVKPVQKVDPPKEIELTEIQPLNLKPLPEIKFEPIREIESESQPD
jgi:ABC-type oligopeptide transport system substrate-binding subunit